MVRVTVNHFILAELNFGDYLCGLIFAVSKFNVL